MGNGLAWSRRLRSVHNKSQYSHATPSGPFPFARPDHPETHQVLVVWVIMTPVVILMTEDAHSVRNFQNLTRSILTIDIVEQIKMLNRMQVG